MARPATRHTFLGSDRLLARAVVRPIDAFLHIEAAGGILLLVATVVALVWANSPWDAAYVELWHTELGLRIGGFEVTEDLRHWVNDGLMALFFLVVGLEIKREAVHGLLASRKAAALPVVAALGGMVVPAVVYLLVNRGGPATDGWGIPMATDIAFAVGVLALLGSRVPPALKVLLLALAIVDDIGAILVIAVVYTDDLSVGWLLLAGIGLLLTVALRWARVWYAPVHVALGLFTWLATLESGVHATIAGVALGLLTPVRPLLAKPDADRIADRLSADVDVDADDVHDIAFRIRESLPLGDRLERALHPWTGYVVIPLFALANAGIPLTGDSVREAAGSAVTAGVTLGLLVGKAVGVLGAAWLAVRSGAAALPAGVRWAHVTGMAVLAGIGFTVSIFVSGLAFDDEALVAQAKLGVLAASVVAAVLGAVLLRRVSDREGA